MSYSPPSDTVEILLPSTIGYEKVARNAVEAIAQEMGFSPDRVEDLKTAVSEACLNAIEHGNQENRAAMVTVVLTTGNEELEINITDEGLTPMPDELPMAERGNIQSRGWGMFFIANLVDQVEVTRLPAGGNSIKMVIRLAPTAASGAAASEKQSEAEADVLPKPDLPQTLPVHTVTEAELEAKAQAAMSRNLPAASESPASPATSQGETHHG